MTDQPEIINKETGEIIDLKPGDYVEITSIQSSGKVLSIVPPYCKVKITRHRNRRHAIPKNKPWTGQIDQCERM